MQQVGEFLDNLIGGGNEVMRMRDVLWVLNEESAGALANPLNEPVITSASQQGFDAVERVTGAAAGGVIRRFSPFIDHGEGQAEIGGDLFGRLFLENLAQQLVGLHGQTMKKSGPIGKSEAGRKIFTTDGHG
jgi:hypothetical protein